MDFLLLTQILLLGLLGGGLLHAAWPAVFIPAWITMAIVFFGDEAEDHNIGLFDEDEIDWVLMGIQFILTVLWAYGPLQTHWAVVFIPTWVSAFSGLLEA